MDFHEFNIKLEKEKKKSRGPSPWCGGSAALQAFRGAVSLSDRGLGQRPGTRGLKKPRL